MPHEPAIIMESFLGHGWAKALEHSLTPGAGPMTVVLTGFNDFQMATDDPTVRRLVDRAIAAVNRDEGRPSRQKPLIHSVDATANTIFPHMCWTPSDPCSPEDLFDKYLGRVLPRLKARCKLNAQGTYFSRMIDTSGVDRNGKDRSHINQLGDIITWWRDHKTPPPSSALQVSILDPAKDHTGSHQRAFPCLQQVSMAHQGGQLELCAFYPSQLVFERGYGNYLGLCNLGTFMAHQLKLQLARVSICVMRPHTDINKKGPLADLRGCLHEAMGGDGG